MSLLDTLADVAAQQVEQDRAETPSKKSITLSDLSDDLLHQIFNFLPTIYELRSFSLVNKRASSWILTSETTSPLFSTAYRIAFGEAGQGRKAWRQLYHVRQALAKGTMRDVNLSLELRTLGILSPEQEAEALGYDNGRNYQNLGYFGFKRLFGDDKTMPLIVWGDFDGVYLVPSIKGFLSYGDSSFQKIAGGSQVLSVEVGPVSVKDNVQSILLFLGYASGHVTAVKLNKRQNGIFSHEILSTISAHEGEVSYLQILSSFDGRPSLLMSGSVDGTVLIYPHSLSNEATFGDAVSLFEGNHEPQEQITCLAASPCSRVVCVGRLSGTRGTLQIWVKGANERSRWEKKGRHVFDGSTPMQVQFQKGNNVFVVGTNSGQLHTFRWSTTDDDFVISLLNFVRTAHAGAIESMAIVGNILLTSSANERIVKGWDIRSMSPIGAPVPVHPGRMSEGASLQSAVVRTIVCPERESLLCLCRDGVVRKLSFAPLATRRDGASARITSIPQSIASLRSVMSHADDVLRGRMEMRIIQASLQNKVTSSFVGADGQRYSDLTSSFDEFSGLHPCSSCARLHRDAFCCRVKNRHNSGLDGSRNSKIFTKLLQSKTAWPKEDEETWLCDSCNVDNMISRKRCFLCGVMKGSGSKRHNLAQAPTNAPKLTANASLSKEENNMVPFFARVTPSSVDVPSSQATTSGRKRKRNPTKNKKPKGSVDQSSIIALLESPIKITKGQRPGTIRVWECRLCNCLNHWASYTCSLCLKKSGGKEWELSWPPKVESAIQKPSPTARVASAIKAKNDIVDGWTCSKCSTKNIERRSLCRSCYASRKRR